LAWGCPPGSNPKVMLKKFLKDNGATSLRVQLWKTLKFTCSKAEAAEHDLEEGTEYTCWVATRDGLTQSGNKVTKGEYFFIEA